MKVPTNPPPLLVLDETTIHYIGVAGVERLASRQNNKLQVQNTEDDPDFCPLVIDTSRDSEPENTPSTCTPGSQPCSAVKEPASKHNTCMEIAMPLPSSPSNYMASIPGDTAMLDNLPVAGYTRNCYSSASSSDSYSMKTSVRQNSAEQTAKDAVRSHGKGSAPCKTRRKGDRILPVEVDGSGSEKFICPVCNDVLLTAADLTKHIRSHNTSTSNTNSCTICGKVLSSQSSLDRHMLVHSGERPFQCRVCQMSFTTNGNMHRHMRIHEKESSSNILAGASGAAKNQLGSHTQSENSTGSAMRLYPMKALLTAKRKFEPETENELPRKRQFTNQMHSASLENVTQLPGNQCLPFKEPIKDKPDSMLPCTACDKKFLCAYGLESHIADSHPELSAFCGSCSQVFPTFSDLQTHKHVVHNQSGVSIPEKKDNSTHSLIPIGFHSLDYMDFSSKTFVNTARVWCEQNQQQPSSSSHDFTCRYCQHAFPMAGALQLHLDTHSPQTTSMCTICDCTFSSLAAYKNHLPKHTSHDIIARYSKMIGTDDNDIQDCISKPEFMMVLGLQLKSSEAPKEKCYRDLSINNVYFEMLPMMSAEKDKPVIIPRPPQGVMPNKQGSTKGQALLEHLQAPVPKKAAALSRSLVSLSPNIKALGSKPGPLVQNHTETDVRAGGVFIKQEPQTDISSVQSAEGGASNDGPFVCQLCDEILASERHLKAHERSHLGVSPYQCNLCNYSSTDKSTLIRHLRTHNGERPFQCRICQFAFTTKANCERHVRKRHAKEEKGEVDSLISCNQVSADRPEYQEAFTSPDTSCKYCGEDFRYFRALKHHLRSHNSCHQKPFVCMLCTAGFSTKANCIRHIQKQHREVSSNLIEGCIQVNDTQNGNGKQVSGNKETLLSSTPVKGTIWERVRPVESPVSNPGGGHRFSTYITSPPVPVLPNIKEECSDSGFEQPLDFSMKAQKATPAKSNELKTATDEVPIDLSMPKRNQKCMSALYPKSENKLDLFHPASSLPEPDDSHDPEEFACGVDTTRDSQMSGSPCSEPDIKSALSGKALPSVTNSAYNSDSELASITKILNATDTAKFKNFFHDPDEPVIQKAQYMSVLTNGRLGSGHGDALDENCRSPSSDISEGTSSMLLPTDHGTTSYSEDGEWEQRKKKRNSYSELPHKLQCPYCPRAFPWISSLNRHILTHTGQKPFKCPQCPVTFSTKSNRERHMVRKHGLDIHDPATRQMMDRPFKCHLCVFSSFSTAAKLLGHYKERHPEREMPHQLAASLAAHYAINGTDHGSDITDSLSTTSEMSNKSALVPFNSNKFEDEEFNQNDGTQKSVSPSISDPPTPQAGLDSTPPPINHDNCGSRHVNPERDNYNVDKITECWKCGAVFESRKNLLRHLKDHSIDLPYKCYLCDASFISRLESLEHKVTRHTSDWDMISEKNKIENIEQFASTQERLVQDTLAGKILKATDDGDESRIDTDYAQRKVYCSLCIKRFWSLQDLRRHMRSHTGERPFECDICQARFTLKHSMMRHRRKHCDAGNPASDEENLVLTDDNGEMPNNNNVLINKPTTVTNKDDDADASSDLLHNLLGVETSAIDKILNSADEAATLLGISKSDTTSDTTETVTSTTTTTIGS